MSRSEAPNARGASKRSYHHGDLRRALLKAAWSLLRQGGLPALNLRALARKVGVTHAAPYHHFRDREALLDAMAEEAFAALDRALSEAAAGEGDPAERFERLGRAYVDFARAHPAYLEVMFRRKPGKLEAPLSELAARTFQHLVDGVIACQQAGLTLAGDPVVLAFSAWSLVHGLAKLWVDGPLVHVPHYGERLEQLRDEILHMNVAAFAAAARSPKP